MNVAEPGRIGSVMVHPRFIALLFVLSVLAAPVHAQLRPNRAWWNRAGQWSSEYYAIKTDLQLTESRPYARHLDRMYEEYARRLSSLPPREPEKLNILLFSRQVDYLHVLRTRYGIDATGTGGMFFVNPNGTAFALWIKGLPTRRVHHVMQHEGFHQFGWSRFGRDLPIWVNEGLAEFFGESVLINGTFVLGQATPHVLQSVRSRIEDETTIPFDHLLRLSDREWGENVRLGRGEFQYRQSWSMIQFLIVGQGRKYQGAFERYLRKLNRAVPSENAWIDVFGPNIREFEDAWKRFALEAKPSAFMTALDRIEFLAEGALELSRRGASSTSLEGLKSQLREIDFVFERPGHESKEIFLARDDAGFDIPVDDLSPDATFVVEAPRPGVRSLREQRWEDRQPTPPSIQTEGLAPNRILIEWSRDRETGEMGYEIRVK